MDDTQSKVYAEIYFVLFERRPDSTRQKEILKLLTEAGKEKGVDIVVSTAFWLEMRWFMLKSIHPVGDMATLKRGYMGRWRGHRIRVLKVGLRRPEKPMAWKRGMTTGSLAKNGM